MRVRLYKKTKDNLSYFQFRNDDDQTILNSQGYTDKEARNNGVRSVVANAGNTDRYDRQTTEGGKHFFILKAGNNQEIARSAEFDSTDEMEAAIADCIAKIPAIPSGEGETKAAEAAPTANNPYRGEDGDDNYRPLAFYQERSKGVDNGFDTFATEEGNFYFTLNLNGKIVLLSESYTSQSGRNNGVDSVTRNLPVGERYQRMLHPNGKHYFNLLAGNNQEIATSVWFDSEGEMNEVIDALNRGLFGGTKEVVMTDAGQGGEGLEGMEGYRASVEITGAPPPAKEAEPKPKKKRKKVKREPKGEKVILKKGTYLFNDVTYETMRSANGKHYFSFRTSEGKSLMISTNIRGYETEEDVDAAVARVLEFGPYEGNYEGKTTKNNKFYFYLNDTEGKRVAKSFFYDTTDAMQEAIGLLIGRGIVAAEGELKAPEAPAAETDDYLPCEKYKGEVGFHKFFNAEDESWYFAWNDSNGNTILRSEGYKSEKARDNGIESVKKNSPIEDRWHKIEDDGQYFWILKAGNHQEIGRSCPYDTEDAALGAVRGAVGALWTPPPPPPKEVKAPRIVDDYLPCAEYNGESGFHKFEKDGEWYFAWNDSNGNTILRSEGYKSEKARDNGIESVKKNSPIEDRWHKIEDDGQYFWILKAGNHQEIGRSCPYDTEDAALGAVRGAVGALWTPPPPPPKEVKAPRIVDDYLPCAEYNGESGFHKFEKDGEWYFAWNDSNGNTILRSEGYKSEKARDNGIESVKKNSPIEDRWHKVEDDGQYFWILKAGNHQEIGRSCPYDTEDAALGAVRGAVGALWTPPPPPPKEVKAPRIVDDYLPCEAYVGDDVGDDGFRRFKEEKEWYFGYVNKDGETVLRSEGYKSVKARDNGIRSVKKNMKIKDHWEKAKTDDGKYYYLLRAGNKQEIARSCYHEDEGAMLAMWGLLPGLFWAAAAAPKVVATPPPPPPPPPPKPEPKPVPPPPPPVAASSGGGRFPWWLLALLGLLLLLGLMYWKGCFGCQTPPPPPPPPPIEEPAPVPEPEPEPVPPPAPTCACNGSSDMGLFNLPNSKSPKSLTRLGTYPEFGNVHSLDAAGFYNKLKDRYTNVPRDKRFLDNLYRAMGYENGFADAAADQFTSTRIPRGTVGNMGYGKRHQTTYASLDVTSDRDTEAFRIEAANGCHINFMKTCGNHFFFCPN